MKNENLFLFAIGAVALISLILAINATISGNSITGNAMWGQKISEKITYEGISNNLNTCQVVEDKGNSGPDSQASASSCDEVCKSPQFGYSEDSNTVCTAAYDYGDDYTKQDYIKSRARCIDPLTNKQCVCCLTKEGYSSYSE